ncbi:MAG: efflux RND transporter periplasmic adaptor subunit [Verrucomicrobia bacterium]|nr:efflux RND transporter periplasmic adaptor subunit [Verrucomicrobiota bacterium]
MKRWLFIIAGICILLGTVAVLISHLSPPTPAIPFPPPVPPYQHFIATLGTVEASSEDVWIGTSDSDIVETVYVQEGDYVKEGSPLFTLRTRVLHAQLEEAETAYMVAVANYEKQLDLPRQESIPPSVALVHQAEARYLDYASQFQIVENLKNPGSVSQDEFNQRKYASCLAKYQLEEAQANLCLLLSGAWVRDLEIFRAEKKQAQASVNILRAQIASSTVYAPFAGVVLVNNIHKGEYAQAGCLDKPLMIFGAIKELHVRVSIVEEEIWRMIEGAPGTAYLRGNRLLSTPLSYVRMQPYMTPKKTLSGDVNEMVDTRVLYLIYKIEDRDLPLYPGQLLDVYLEAKPSKEIP